MFTWKQLLMYNIQHESEIETLSRWSGAQHVF